MQDSSCVRVLSPAFSCFSLFHRLMFKLQVISAASAASSTDAAESALRDLEALLAKEQAPFSPTLHRLRAQLLLQLGRCRHMPASCLPCPSDTCKESEGESISCTLSNPSSQTMALCATRPTKDCSAGSL